MNNRSFALTILQWFREHGRSLPWRDIRDPYAIWLSEIILQQTRISQGMAYWERFMRTFPTVEALASASEDEVLKLWQGLGYYSRARNLHHAARQIADMGHFPKTFEDIKQLKGVGDYTAAAIGSIAFNLPVAVVDGNVFRVLSRYFSIDTPINTTRGKHEFTALAQSLLPPDRASAYNQGIMDFGAIQCTPLSPNCPACPLMETCVACREHRVAELPYKEKTLKIKTRYLTYVFIESQGHIAFHRRGGNDIWRGLWEPFNASVHENERTETIDEIARFLDLASHRDLFQLLDKGVRHVLTHRILMADFYLLSTPQRPTLPADYVWIDLRQLGNYAVPRLIERMLQKIQALHLF